MFCAFYFDCSLKTKQTTVVFELNPRGVSKVGAAVRPKSRQRMGWEVRAGPASEGRCSSSCSSWVLERSFSTEGEPKQRNDHYQFGCFQL